MSLTWPRRFQAPVNRLRTLPCLEPLEDRTALSLGVGGIYPSGAFPRALAVGDVNHDGRPDLVVANNGGDSVSLLIGTGNGAFQTQQVLAVGHAPRGLTLADFNGDGRPDLVVANGGGGSVSVLLGVTGGGFGPAQD